MSLGSRGNPLFEQLTPNAEFRRAAEMTQQKIYWDADTLTFRCPLGARCNIEPSLIDEALLGETRETDVPCGGIESFQTMLPRERQGYLKWVRDRNVSYRNLPFLELHFGGVGKTRLVRRP